jgi:hypothetical protein
MIAEVIDVNHYRQGKKRLPRCRNVALRVEDQSRARADLNTLNVFSRYVA